jgi:hypothetical protein
MARKISIPYVAFLKLEEVCFITSCTIVDHVQRFVRSLAQVQNKPAPSTVSKYRIAKVLLAATAGLSLTQLYPTNILTNRTQTDN